MLTTHYMREADELCDEIAFIKGGQILARGTPGELKRQIRLGEVIALRLDPARVRGSPRRRACSGAWRSTAGSSARWTRPRSGCPELLRALYADGVVIRNVQVREPELEEVFVELAK